MEDLQLNQGTVLGYVEPVKYVGNREGQSGVNSNDHESSNFALWQIETHDWEELTNEGELKDLCIKYVEQAFLLETPSMLRKEEGLKSTPSFRILTSQTESDSSLFFDRVKVYDNAGNETSSTDQGQSSYDLNHLI